MLGRRSQQRGLFEADTQYADFVGKDNFYGFLAGLRDEVFKDEDFAAIYDELGRGRPSVPPSMLMAALILQTYAGVSDEETTERAAYDLRWKVALGIKVDERPFAKSTLQLFRAHLLLHEKAAEIFARVLSLARERGFLKKRRRMRVALDTTNILGRGAVKDTYNLLADGIVLVLRELAQLAGEALEDYARERGLGGYLGERSLKGEAELDWDSKEEREGFLRGIVSDADQLLEEVRQVRGRLREGSPEDEGLKQAAGRLSQILLQDIERAIPDQCSCRGALVAVAKKQVSRRLDGPHGIRGRNHRHDGQRAQRMSQIM